MTNVTTLPPFAPVCRHEIPWAACALCRDKARQPHAIPLNTGPRHKSESGMGMVPLRLEVPAPIAERLAHTLERLAVGCEERPHCDLGGYRDKLKAAFETYCPKRPYTGTPADVDTLLAFLVSKLAERS